jgi:hypothetical protein
MVAENLNLPQKVSYVELNEALGGEFVLFVGSAVSGFWINTGDSKKRFLPMVHDVTQGFFSALTSQLRGANYVDRLTEEYCKSLINRGKYKQIRLSTKFETFLWQVENRVGSANILRLIQALYLCDQGQYGSTHSTISALMRFGRVKLCFTTNFDNALENSLPRVTKVVHGIGDFYTEIDTPTIIKLHGDVIEGKIVTTTPNLARGANLREYEYLQDILNGRTVLFVGYSGVGDIDIAPVLEALGTKGTKLVWLVREGEQPPSFATHWFESDLFSQDIERNWLLRLATETGFEINNRDQSAPDWESRLASWMKKISNEEANNLVRDVLGESNGWAYLHLYHVSTQWSNAEDPPSLSSSSECIYFAEACINVAAYNTAIRALTKGLLLIQKPKEWFVITKWLGFCYWRIGLLDDALNLLQVLVHKKPIMEDFEEHYLIGLLFYIETSIDKARYLDKDKRRALYDSLELKTVSQKLTSTKTNDPGANIIRALRAEAIELMVGTKTDLDNVISYYHQAVALQSWGLAESVARVWAEFDPKNGIMALMNVDKVLIRRGHLNTVRKSVAVYLESLPLLGRLRPIYYLDGAGWNRIKAEFVEWRYRKKKAQWYVAYRENKIFIE